MTPKKEGVKGLQEEAREVERIAMNIVYQIGDALYEALPKDVAHDHFVDARQKTNDIAIDFARKLITESRASAYKKALEDAEGIIKKEFSKGIQVRPTLPVAMGLPITMIHEMIEVGIKAYVDDALAAIRSLHGR